jgi:hypothetical protein
VEVTVLPNLLLVWMTIIVLWFVLMVFIIQHGSRRAYFYALALGLALIFCGLAFAL